MRQLPLCFTISCRLAVAPHLDKSQFYIGVDTFTRTFLTCTRERGYRICEAGGCYRDATMLRCYRPRTEAEAMHDNGMVCSCEKS